MWCVVNIQPLTQLRLLWVGVSTEDCDQTRQCCNEEVLVKDPFLSLRVWRKILKNGQILWWKMTKNFEVQNVFGHFESSLKHWTRYYICFGHYNEYVETSTNNYRITCCLLCLPQFLTFVYIMKLYKFVSCPNQKV